MEKRFIDFLSEYNQIPKEAITPDKDLIMDLEITSFDLLEMCYKIEEEFNVKMDASVLCTFRTVGDIIKYLEQNSEE